MRLDSFVKLKYELVTIILFVGIKYSMRDLLLTSIIMPDLQTSDMRQIRQMMLALSLSSACLCKLQILCLNNLLHGDLCKKYLLLPYFPFFWFSNMILSDAFILPISQLQTQQVMTSLIRSHRIFNTDLTYSCSHFVV